MELERTVILQEIGQSYDTPDDILFDYFQDAAYPNQPIGWPILGPAEIIKTMPRQTLMDFMHGHYHPSRMVVAAAGNVDHAQLCDLVAKHYTVFNTKVPAKPVSGVYKGGDKREQRTLEQLHLALGFQGVSMNDDNYFTANLYSNILGSGMASRLFQEIREKRGLVYTIYSFLTAQEDTGVFGVYAGTSSKDGAELMKVLHEELQKSTHTLTEAELDRAKRQTKAGMVFAYESPLSRVKRLAYHLLMYDRIIDLQETVGKIEAVTLDGVHACAKEMLATPTTFAAVGPLEGLKE
jgi:predicted Zn-dependent peptidase